MPLKMGIDLRWLAGFFDGEGCVNITRVGKKRHPELRVYVTNTDEAIVHLIASATGGRVSKARVLRTGWKANRNVIWTARRARKFLETIRPYVLLKKAQVELGIAFSQQREDRCRSRYNIVRGRTGRTYRVLTETALSRDLEVLEMMNTLNKKGA